MNDIELPPTKEDMIVKPGGAADLGAFLDWNKFGLAQWVELIKNNNLLSGVRMDQAYGPTPSAYPLVKAPPSLDKFYTYRNPNAYIDSQTTYSMRDSKYISQGWAKASLSVGTPFVSAAAEASYQQMSSKHTVGKKIFTTAKYKYGFVTIVMDPKDMEPSDKFTTAIKEAVKRSSEDEKKEALKDVFKKFGHSFQTEVTLGGVLVSTESTTTTATMTEEKFEAELKAKLSGAAGAGLYSASAAAAGGFSKDVMEKAMEQQQRLTITAKGGNPLLSSAIGSWIPSVADYRTWRIIDVRSAVSVTEFIRDADLKTQVEKLTAADPQAQARPLRGRCIPNRAGMHDSH
ncbi:hypothetical protein BOTBODRAFT_427142 [Botryobasidium botryosum FD-172 SS1]|uniref:MACPF domain-containing protein n=1 Tax=Botryobasidium botryosum (strain FD-172 SS1) TaxID=930990 RepID=A0A067M8S9_BOTB1|nr:hypothetical protein BOTBODRAFT_427142 [Botryobasidium botryosum FD-172 SS1]